MEKRQLLQLRRLAHTLSPVVIIGSEGLSEGVHGEIETALEAHELIKIRVNAADREERSSMIETICEAHQAEVVQRIGHIVVVYRKNTV